MDILILERSWRKSRDMRDVCEQVSHFDSHSEVVTQCALTSLLNSVARSSGHRAVAVLAVADTSGWSIHFALAGKEFFAAHDFLLGIASRSLCAHSSQQTSTTRVPILTVMALSSSSQSQAAQVFSVIISSPLTARASGMHRRSFRVYGRCRNL
jgi:hypothetical protein